MREKTVAFVKILLISLLPTLLVWAPFYFRMPQFWSIPLPSDGIQTIAANYDGPLYIVVAKTFYNTQLIQSTFSFPLPLEYYAAHFPLYPALIWIAGSTLNFLFGNTFGFPWGMLLVTLLSSIVTIAYFRAYIADFVSKENVLFVTFLFAIFPARWLIARSTGTPEPLFMGAILASIFHFNKRQYARAGLWGAVAQLTKSPGILLFAAYALYIGLVQFRRAATTSPLRWLKTFPWGTYPILLMPVALLGIFWLYGNTFNDYLAYFHSGDNIHLLFPPFQIFDYSQSWVGTHWLEEIVFIYLLAGFGVVKMFKMKMGMAAWFSLVFLTSIIFVSHRDIVRYSLPILPFLYAAYSETITKKEFKYVVGLIVLPIYLFSLSYIANNIMPIADWGPLL
jgi:hypothetical protein